MIRIHRDIPLTLDWVHGLKTMDQLAEEYNISRARVGQITTRVLQWAGATMDLPVEVKSYRITRIANLHRGPRIQRDTPQYFYQEEQCYRSDDYEIARAHGAVIYNDNL